MPTTQFKTAIAFFLALSIVFLTISRSARAMPAVRLAGPGDWQLGVWTGFSDAVLPLGMEATVGLTPVIGAGGEGIMLFPLTLCMGLTVPSFEFDLRDHRTDLGLEMPLVKGPWELRIAGGLREVGTANDALMATALGTTLGMSVGLHGERWMVAGEARNWVSWATHLRTTQYAEDQGGALHFQGWTFRTAGSLQAGLRSGVLWVLDDGASRGRQTARALEFALRAGYQTRGEYNLVVPPLYVELSGGFRF